MYDLIIIGAGAGGLTAGLYAGRFRMKTLILEKMAPGGQIILSSMIENYPGFPGGIATLELIERFRKQVEELGINIEGREVTAIEPNSKLGYRINTQEANFETRAIIIATGANAKHLGVAGEEKFIGRGVSYCATCDAPLFKNKDVAVIGGGDRALEEAIFLSGYAKSVNLVHRRSEFRASKILVNKAKEEPKINFVLDSIVEEIAGKDRVGVVKIKDVKTSAKKDLACDGVFIFVGIQPNTIFLKKLLELDELGFIITDKNMQASKQGIFACGDCIRKSLYQVITACGDGAVAADSAHKYLARI